MKKLSNRSKMVLGISLIGLLVVSGHFAGFWSALGADEMDLTTRSLKIDGSVKSGGGQQVIVWDKDGPITVTKSYGWFLDPDVYVVESGYLYPEMHFTVGNLKYEGVYDNITITTKINDTHNRIDNYVIYDYSFNAWIKAEADASVVKGEYSAYEGKFASESSYQPSGPLSYTATVGLDIEPFKWTVEEEGESGYGITWMQLSSIDITENDFIDSYESSAATVMYAADRDLTNVGATWGSNYQADELSGKDLPLSADLSLIGSYRAGSWNLYDPSGIAALYQVVPIEPVIEVTCTLHIAGHNFYIEDETVPTPPTPPTPPPIIPPPEGLDYILILILVVASIPILVFGLPRVIYALRRKR